MEEYTLEELIDTFLKGKMTDEDHNLLIHLINTDPSVSVQVNESIETYRFLEYARYQDTRKRLREFDEKANKPKHRSVYRALGVAFIFCFIAAISGWVGLVQYCKPVNLAKRNFELIHGTAIANEKDKTEDPINWDLANDFFVREDFQNAARLFQPYSESPDHNFKTQAKWNLLMCHLASEGPTIRWQEEVKKFLLHAPEPLKSKGIKLLAFIDSSFYRLAVQRPSSHFSLWKPRLI